MSRYLINGQYVSREDYQEHLKTEKAKLEKARVAAEKEALKPVEDEKE